LANGDVDDDRQLEDEDDPDDPIADDDGFAHQWKVKEENVEEWGRRPQVFSYAQLGESSLKGSKFSDELADGLEEDNQQVEDDNSDDIANEQYVQLSDESEGMGHAHPAPAWIAIKEMVDSKKSLDHLY